MFDELTFTLHYITYMCHTAGNLRGGRLSVILYQLRREEDTLSVCHA